jgi:hypothetical protein
MSFGGFTGPAQSIGPLVVLSKIGLCLNMVLCNEFRRFLPGLRKASDRYGQVKQT